MIRFLARYSFFLLAFLLFTPTVFAQLTPYPVYLIGNTATKPLSTENYTLLKQELDRQTTPFTVIHLGDIAGNNGWPEYPNQEQIMRLNQLLHLVRDNPKGKLLLIPGDKDWGNSGKNGLKAVRRLEKYVRSQLPYANAFIPGAGCPGPEVLDINPFLRVVAINSSWWMHPYDKPEITDTDCKILTRQEFVEELEEDLTSAENRNVLVVGHHPLLSGGVYGGRMPFTKHLFPFADKNPGTYIPVPGLGSIYASFRQNIGTPRDMANFRYAEFREKLQRIFKQNPGIVYAAAHEYDLQLLETDENYHVISGSLTEKEPVGKKTETLFSAAETGFVKLEYFPDGEVKTHFYKMGGASITPLYSRTLFQSPCAENPGAAPANRYFIPCPAPDSIPEVNLEVQNGLVKLAAGPHYQAGPVKKLFFGRLYRSTWATPVQVPLLDLRRTYGGLKPVGRGGGRQTSTLQFKARNGTDYVFRSVDKEPVKGLPEQLRSPFARKLVREITATQHPYGALIVSALLDSTDILHARPQLFVLPNDAALGPYRPQYAGLFGMLEARPLAPAKGRKGFAGADEILRTYGLFRKLYEDNQNRLDAYAFGKARAFDIWVGDYGRHDDNWRWAGFKNSLGQTVYKPIPRDRDQSFAQWDGLFPWLADLPFAVNSIQDFGTEMKGIRSLTYPARHLDRALLQSLTRQDWQRIAAELQQQMREPVIDKAIASQPAETIPVSGNKIGYKLKKRMQELPQALDEYYLDLARIVDIIGSNKSEYFKVERLANGSVRVQQFESEAQASQPDEIPLFDRTFYPEETAEIRIFALDGKDVITVTGKSESSMLVRLIGGDGEDVIRDDSSVPGRKHYTRVYDVPRTEMQLGPEAKNLTAYTQNINDYNRQDFRYNYKAPLPGILYNRSDGLGGSLTLKFGRYLFREPEEKRIYIFNIRGTDQGAFQFSAAGLWNNVWGPVAAGGGFTYGGYFPFYNFFGLGNNTEKVNDLHDELYYRSRYKGLKVNAFAESKFLQKSYFRIGPLYEHLESSPQNGTILNEETAQDLITGQESLAGGLAELDFDLRDNQNFTLRGLRFSLRHTTYQRLSRGKNAFGLNEFSGQYFGTARIRIPVTLALKLGGAKNYGRDLPFYKYTSLGLRDNLRGYLNNRFFGDQSAYVNTELRFHVGQIKNSLFPLYYGIVTFYDQGKVWYRGSDAGGWHRGYGVGFYVAPLEQRYALNVQFGHSEEEKLQLIFSLGLVLDR